MNSSPPPSRQPSFTVINVEKAPSIIAPANNYFGYRALGQSHDPMFGGIFQGTSILTQSAIGPGHTSGQLALKPTTVGSKNIRALEIVRVRKLILNAVL